MTALVGIVLVVVMVFGGYLLAGGKLAIILKALPFEFMMIAGAAAGAFALANDGAAIRHTLRDLTRVASGPRWRPGDYRDLLCLLFALIRVSRSNPVALEQHVEQPASSPLFGRYPRILADAEAVGLICDTLRAGSMNYDDPHQVEAVLEARLEAHRQHALHSAHALQSVADALPALGIVAAVLGVIKTMSSIDQPPEVLGKMIGGALVGTFLGVFLAYGFVGPVAARLRHLAEEDCHFYDLIRQVLVANLHAHPPQLCIEAGRQAMPGRLRPGFGDLEESLRSAREAA